MSSFPELERFVHSSAGSCRHLNVDLAGLIKYFLTHCLLIMVLGTGCTDNYGSNFQAFEGNRVSLEQFDSLRLVWLLARTSFVYA